MPHKTLTPFDGVLVTIRSKKSFFEVTKAIESRLQRFSISKLKEYVTQGDREGQEAYVGEVSAPSKFSIFSEFDQGPTMRLAGIPIEFRFYLVGNAVIARGLFRYSGAAVLGAPVRICVSQRDGEQTRIDMDLPSVFFGKFPEMRESDVPKLLDAEMVKSSRTPPRDSAQFESFPRAGPGREWNGLSPAIRGSCVLQLISLMSVTPSANFASASHAASNCPGHSSTRRCEVDGRRSDQVSNNN